MLAVFLLSGCTEEKLSFLDPQGPVAAAQRTHFFEVIWLVAIVVLPVIVLTPLLAWRYRYGNSRASYRPSWSFSWPLEVAIWGVPAAIVGVTMWLLWGSTHRLDPYKQLAPAENALHVQVVGYDWKWLFIYPDLGLASVGRLAFPSDRPLALHLTSGTVMQSFFVPALGSQIYAMNGMVTQLNLKADAPGRFLGENTQYNGTGFHEQKFVAEAMSSADFDAWVAEAHAAGVPLDALAYDALAAQNTTRDLVRLVRREPSAGAASPGSPLTNGEIPDTAVTFRDVPAGLFEKIVAGRSAGVAGSVFRTGRATVPDRADQADAAAGIDPATSRDEVR